ncbi:MAG TPA: phage tail protein [bacterium]|nr:phage tail protein [bacterium]
MDRAFPPTGFHFRVEFVNVEEATEKDVKFREVSGLSAELGIEEVTEGGENRFTHRLPSRGKYSNLVLKRGLLTDSGLIKWIWDAIESFKFQPSDVNVTLLNEQHEPVAETYSFNGAWPQKWSISDFNAQDNSIVVESLELVYKYFTRTALD